MSALAATPSVPGDLVTVFLSSSPRPQDSENDAGAIMLHQALLSVRRTLGLERAPAVCIFDGRHPALPEEQWAAYQRKISLIKAGAAPFLTHKQQGSPNSRPLDSPSPSESFLHSSVVQA